MTCHHVKLPGGATAIVCGPKPRAKRCKCGKPATLLCDWKIGDGKTCDDPICPNCALAVAEDKHLCAWHQVNYQKWLDAKAARA